MMMQAAAHLTLLIGLCSVLCNIGFNWMNKNLISKFQFFAYVLWAYDINL